MSVKKEKKLFTCFFLSDVLCSWRKTEHFGVMSRCFSCPFFLKFQRKLEEEEEAFWDEVDRIRKYGYFGRRD